MHFIANSQETNFIHPCILINVHTCIICDLFIVIVNGISVHFWCCKFYKNLQTFKKILITTLSNPSCSKKNSKRFHKS